MPGKPPNMELPEIPPAKGMTLRDWFAGQALPMVVHAGVWDTPSGLIAKRAYEIADAMLAERGEHE